MFKGWSNDESPPTYWIVSTNLFTSLIRFRTFRHSINLYTTIHREIIAHRNVSNMWRGGASIFVMYSFDNGRKNAIIIIAWISSTHCFSAFCSIRFCLSISIVFSVLTTKHMPSWNQSSKGYENDFVRIDKHEFSRAIGRCVFLSHWINLMGVSDQRSKNLTIQFSIMAKFSFWMNIRAMPSSSLQTEMVFFFNKFPRPRSLFK